MPSAPKIEGSKLIVLRLAGIAMLIFLANHAYIGHMTGTIEVGTRRNALTMTGDNLWLGFLFLISSAATSMFLLFINYGQTKTFILLAKIFGSTWFVVLGLCIFNSMSAR